MIDYNTEITEIRNKIPTATGLVNNAALNAKGTEIENKIPGLINLTKKAALNTKETEVEINIPDIPDLTAKAALNAKAAEIEKKTLDTTDFITIPEINRLTRIGFESRIKDIAKSLASKCHVNIALDIKRQK